MKKVIIIGILFLNIFLFANEVNSHKTLTLEELNYLKQKKQITMCIDPNWMPFEKFDKNGKHIGMTADYYKIFKSILNTDINIIQTTTWDETLENAKSRKCDIISLAMETPERKKYLNFTTPYLKVPLVIATKLDVSFINNLEFIKDKKVGIPKGYAFIEILKKKYKNIKIIEVKNVEDGLDKVNKGKLFGFIGTLASISHMFQTGSSGELKVTGKFKEQWELGIAVRNDDIVLLNILQKVVDSLDIKQQQQILNDWVSIKYEKGIDYTLVWEISILFVVIFFIGLLLLLKQRKLKNNILEQKEKFEAIYNGSKDSIAVLDMKSNFLEVNQSYIEMTGYTKEELLNTSCFNLTAPKDIEPSKEAIQEVLKVGFIKNFEKDCIVKNNTYITINMSMSLLHNPDRVLISVRDITDIKQQEILLLQQSKMVSMGEMIGNIAHQWRQPLSVITTASTGMQIQKEHGILTDEFFNESCDVINDNAQYLSKTIDDFRNFIEGDRTKKIFTLKSSINSFLNLVDGSIKNDDINIILNLEEDIKIDGYENELNQCLINIFNNAKDALTENIKENRLIFISTLKENDKALIKIKDNANGIPSSIIHKIFEPYFTTKHQAQGTGLGLHMTYNLIVDGMNGTIKVSNVEYKYDGKNYIGAEFIISLPLYII